MYRLARFVKTPKTQSKISSIRSFTTVIKEALIDHNTKDNAENCSNNRSLPEELAKKVMTLKCETTDGGVCDVVLVGTCHVSKVPTVREMAKRWIRERNLFGILLSYYTAKVACELKVIPGYEFRVAYEEATKYGGKVILGDLPVQNTVEKLWDKLSVSKLFSSLLFQADFLPSLQSAAEMAEDDDVDVDKLTIVTQQLSKQFPAFAEILIHERDKHMSSELLKVASEHNSVVAVVGKGHLPGIQMNWKQSIQAKGLPDTSVQKPAIPVAKIIT